MATGRRLATIEGKGGPPLSWRVALQGWCRGNGRAGPILYSGESRAIYIYSRGGEGPGPGGGGIVG